MSLGALFGKLQGHEMELDRLKRHEQTHEKLEKCEWSEVKVRSFALRFKYDGDKNDNLNLKITKMMHYSRNVKTYQGRKRQRKLVKEKHQLQARKLFILNVEDNVMSECPTRQKKIKVNNKKDKKSKRAYVAWQKNEISLSSDEEKVTWH